MWIWGACSINNPDIFVYGKNIHDFMHWCFQQKKLYFHNLKFDGAFITHWLLSNNYKFVKEKPRVGEFTAIISDTGKWYTMEIRSQFGVTKIWDSYKKLPFTLSKIAKAFNLEESKGEIDYTRYRSENHEPSEDELEYLKNDCVILSKALKIQLDQGLNRITIGSDALNWYKEMSGKQFNRLFPNYRTL